MLDALAAEVANTLNTTVYHREIERALRTTEGLTAWQAVQRALNWSKDIDPATLDEGLLEAERAVAIDPDYGMAHAVLAYVCMCVSFFWGGNQRERARVHLDKALKLSPNDAPTLTWAAETSRRLGDPAKALQLAKRALRSSPGAFAANAMVGSALNDLGRHEEALAHLDTELRVAPTTRRTTTRISGVQRRSMV